MEDEFISIYFYCFLLFFLSQFRSHLLTPPQERTTKKRNDWQLLWQYSLFPTQHVISCSSSPASCCVVVANPHTHTHTPLFIYRVVAHQDCTFSLSTFIFPLILVPTLNTGASLLDNSRPLLQEYNASLPFCIPLRRPSIAWIHLHLPHILFINIVF